MCPSSEQETMTTPAFTIEIASMEHPRLLIAALDEADARGVSIGRISQGGGLRMLTESEAREMVDLAHARAIDVFMFVSPRNSFDPLTDPSAGDQLRGERAFAEALEDLGRCAAMEVDGVLIADVGLLAAAGDLVRRGELKLKLKSAAAIAPHNAAAAALYERLGATSINVPSTAPLEDLVAMRARLSASTTLDIYVESPASFGGGLRYNEIPAIVERLAPVSLKFGLRNAAALYPYGAHLEPFAERTIREKVRRVEIALAALVQPSPLVLEPN
jgi:hypothetical protein